MSSAHPRVPVRLQTWEETLRRCAEPINYLLDRKSTTGIMTGLNLVGFSIPATSPGTIIAPWTRDLSTTYMESDPVTGLFTIKEDGLYRISGAVLLLNGTQNVDYRLEVDINGTTTILSTQFWSSVQQTSLTLSGSGGELLSIDDVLSLRLFASSAGTVDIPSGTFSIEQVT